MVESGGTMLLPLDPGDHVVRFSYRTPGLDVGIAISGLSIVAFALLVWRARGRSGLSKVAAEWIAMGVSKMVLRIRYPRHAPYVAASPEGEVQYRGCFCKDNPIVHSF